MERLNNLINPQPIRFAQCKHQCLGVGVKITLMVLIAIIVSAAIGGNGCLWVGPNGDNDASNGSSGAIASSPNPANGATNVAITVYGGTVQLSWVSVSGALSYDVFIGITPTVSYLTNVPNTPIRTRYTPTFTVNYSTTYRWRIDTHIGTTIYMGTPWYFTTATQVFAFTNPSPANGATNIPITSILSWNAVPTAASYDVYFGTTSVPSFRANVTSPTYNPGALSYNVRYYWHINAKNVVGSGGTVIAGGNLWSFTTVTTLNPASSPSPSNGAGNVLTTTILSWAPSPAATMYDVYLGLNVICWTKIASIPKSIPRTTYTLTPGLITYGTQYYWKVNGNPPDPLGVGITWTFTTQTSLPAQVGTPTPSDTAGGVAITSTLGWVSAHNATSYGVYLGSASAGMTPTFRTNTMLLTYNPGTLLYSTPYYWRIDSMNNTGVTTGNLWHFTTVAKTPPQPVTAPAPPTGTVNCSINTVLTWAEGVPQGGTDSYDVYFGTANPPSLVTTTVKTVYRTRYVPTTPLAYFTVYYWKIIAKNSGGMQMTPGPVWNFKTVQAYPSQVGNPSPLSGRSGCAINQVLNWAKATNATSYDIYFAATSSLNASNFRGNTFGMTYTPAGLLWSRTYYWRIDARNSTGITTGLTWNFHTLTLPDAVVVTAPNPPNPAFNVPITQTLTWNDAARADSYNVYLDTAQPIHNLITNTTLTSFNPTLAYTTTYHWRVDAMNPAGTIAGAPQAFTTRNPSVLTALVFVQQPTTTTAGAIISPPVTVRPLDQYGYPITSADISITTTDGTLINGIRLCAQSGTGSGIAIFNDLRITTTGTYTLTASAVGVIPVTSNPFNITAAGPASISFVQQPTTATADAVISPTVEILVKDQFNNNVSNAWVSVTTTNGTLMNGTLTQISVGSPTGQAGLATFNDLNITLVGTGYALTGSCTGCAAITSKLFDITAGAIDHFTVAGIPNAISAGAKSSPTVTAYDICKNVKTDYLGTISFTSDDIQAVLPADYTFIPTESGRHTFNGGGGEVTLKTAGTNHYVKVLDASAGIAQIVRITVTAGTASKLVFTQQHSNGAQFASGAAFSPVLEVAVQDSSGNTRTDDNATTITLTGNGTILGGTTTRTVVNGVATFDSSGGNSSVTVGTTAGTGKTVTADSSPSYTSATSSTFDITAGSPNKLGFMQQHSNGAQFASGAAFSPVLKVAVQDSSGNTRTDDNATTITLTGNGTTLGGTFTRTVVNGVATFDSSGGNSSVTVGTTVGTGKTLSATSGSLLSATSSVFDITPGPANSLAFIASPPASTPVGQNFTSVVTVRVRDAYNNNIAGANVSITTTNGTALYGTLTRITDASGIATFSPLSMTLVGSYTLSATDGALATTSTGFSITVGAANNIAFSANPPTSTTAGQNFGSAITVRVSDAYHNNISSASVTITTTNGTALYGTLTRITDASGIATFSPLSMTLVGSYTLSATCGALATTSGAFNISAATANKLVWVSPPPTSNTAGSPWSTFSIEIDDVYGNRISTDSSTTVTLSKVTGSNAITVGNTANVQSGIAFFSSVAYYKAETITIKGTVSGLPNPDTPASGNIVINPGVIASLAFVTQPSNTVAGLAMASFTVQAKDSYGNNENSGMKVTLTANPSATIGGTNPGTSDATGITTFVDINISAPYNGYTFTAANGAVNTTSTSFNITAITWSNYRSITINNSGSAQTDYQVLLQPFRDTGDFVGNNLDNSNLGGSWPFSEGTGTSTTSDISGNNNMGTLQNSPTWTGGRYGNALNFNGTNQFVSVPHSASLEASTQLTIEVWIMRNVAGQNHAIVSKGTANGANCNYTMVVNSSNQLFFFVQDGTSGRTLSGSATLSAGQWYHVALTVDTASTTAKFYVNGVLDAQNTAFTGVPAQSARTLRIGVRDDSVAAQDGTSLSQYFNGIIDEVKIYKRVLTAAEISMRYGSGLVGSWHFNENGGTVARDNSGNGLNGTLSTASWTSGKCGSAFNANGANYINVGTFYPPNNITIAGWVNFNSIGSSSDYQYLYSVAHSDGWYDTTFGIQDSTHLFFEVYLGSSANGGAYTAVVPALQPGTWYYLVATQAGPTVAPMLYLNGQSYAATGSFAGTPARSSQPNSIGRAGGRSMYYLKGLIDEVKLFNRVLSSAEIQAGYNSKVKYDYSDVRFTDSAGAEEYNYWQETDTRFWVKITGTLNAGATVLRMSYNNPSATTATSGPNTFIAYSDGSDYASWLPAATNMNVTNVGGELYFLGTANSNSTNKTVNCPLTCIIEGKFRNTSITNQAILIGTGSNMTEANFLCGQDASTSTQWQDPYGTVIYSGLFALNTYYVIKEVCKGSGSPNYDHYLYNANRNSLLASKLGTGPYNTTEINPITRFWVLSESTGRVSTYITWIYARQYVPVEPTTTSPGAEQ